MNGHALFIGLSAEGKDLLDQVLGPVGGLHGLPQIVHGGPLAEHGKLGESDDRREDVVEIVRDAACQRPDRFHLLGLQELGFEFLFVLVGCFARGDVLNQRDEIHGFSVLVTLDARPDEGPDHRAVAVDEPALLFAGSDPAFDQIAAEL